MNEASHRTPQYSAPTRVVVVGEPHLHEMLAHDADIELLPHRFDRFDAFHEAVRAQRVPLDQPTAIVVSSALAASEADLRAFVNWLGSAAVVVGGARPANAHYVSDPGDHNELRAAIGRSTRGAALAPIPNQPREFVADTEWHFERSDRVTPTPADLSADFIVALPGERSRATQRPLAPAPPVDAAASFPLSDRTRSDHDFDTLIDGLLPPAAPSYASIPTPSPATHTTASTTPVSPPPGFFTGPNATTRAFTNADMPGPDTRPERQIDGCKVFAVYSPKGGVGKTSIAVNLAAHVALRTRLQVCIVDLDVGFGNVGTRLGVFTPTIRKLLVEPELDQEAIARNLAYDERTGLHALLAPLRPEAGADRKLLKPAVYDRILALLVDRFDVVFLDCSVELNDPLVSQFALARAHKTIVVVNNEQATLLDARRAVEAMTRPKDAQRLPGLGLDPDRLHIVLNQKVDGVGKEANQIHDLLTGGDPNHPNNRIPIIATFPDDRHLWVGQANLARTVAGAGVAEVDVALDAALEALFDGTVGAPAPLPSAWMDEPLVAYQDDHDHDGAGFLSKFTKRFRK